MIQVRNIKNQINSGRPCKKHLENLVSDKVAPEFGICLNYSKKIGKNRLLE